ncbi:MAG TPA: hypothetical protein PKC97_16565 [Burkholderiaceae bacterium]|nr:hypothetical protein [Burkholderiaceae bacterium]
MARMAFSAAQTDFRIELATAGLALVPTEIEAQPGWSIDDESMGPGWHDSSWMLKKGLDVIEDPPPAAIPTEWALRWWIASNAAPAPR